MVGFLGVCVAYNWRVSQSSLSSSWRIWCVNTIAHALGVITLSSGDTISRRNEVGAHTKNNDRTNERSTERV